MSTHLNSEIHPEHWVTPAEAARLRGVTRQAITKLIRAGRVGVLEIGGRRLIRRSDIVNFERRKPGRRKKRRDSNAKG